MEQVPSVVTSVPWPCHSPGGPGDSKIRRLPPPALERTKATVAEPSSPNAMAGAESQEEARSAGIEGRLRRPRSLRCRQRSHAKRQGWKAHDRERGAAAVDRGVHGVGRGICGNRVRDDVGRGFHDPGMRIRAARAVRVAGADGFVLIQSTTNVLAPPPAIEGGPESAIASAPEIATGAVQSVAPATSARAQTATRGVTGDRSKRS